MKRLAILVIVLLAVGAAGIAYYTHSVHKSQSHALAIILGDDEHAGLLSKHRSLAPIVAAQFADYKGNSIRWSAAYHGCLYFSAFLGLLGTLILKIGIWPKGWDDKKRMDYAAVFAALSAFMITVSTSGDFQGKWQASRLAATKTGSVAFDLLKLEENIPPEVVAELQEIFLTQNLAVIGEGKKPAAPKKPDPDKKGEAPKGL